MLNDIRADEIRPFLEQELGVSQERVIGSQFYLPELGDFYTDVLLMMAAGNGTVSVTVNAKITKLTGWVMQLQQTYDLYEITMEPSNGETVILFHK